MDSALWLGLRELVEQALMLAALAFGGLVAGGAMATAAEVAAVDAFLADQKTLAGAPPEFGPSSFYRQGAYEWAATWPIQNSRGVVETGHLRFAMRRPGLFSIAVVLKAQGISRLDFEEEDECHGNPHWASAYGLPAIVCGPHFHSWDHNRDTCSLQIDGTFRFANRYPCRSAGLTRHFLGWRSESTWC
jgi:hypothetical protein